MVASDDKKKTSCVFTRCQPRAVKVHTAHGCSTVVSGGLVTARDNWCGKPVLLVALSPEVGERSRRRARLLGGHLPAQTDDARKW